LTLLVHTSPLVVYNNLDVGKRGPRFSVYRRLHF